MAEPRADADDLRRMIVQLSRLVEISVTLNATLDRPALLRFIATSAADVLEAGSAVILLVDPNTRRLQPVGWSGSRPPAETAGEVPQEGTIAGTVLRERRPVILNQVNASRAPLVRAPELPRPEAHSLLAVPIFSRHDAIGVLEVADKRSGAFDESDARTLTIIASQAGVAIHNARLLQDLQDANRELGRLDKLKSDFIDVAGGHPGLRCHPARGGRRGRLRTRRGGAQFGAAHAGADRGHDPPAPDGRGAREPDAGGDRPAGRAEAGVRFGARDADGQRSESRPAPAGRSRAGARRRASS
jgi:hypothetical protein